MRPLSNTSKFVISVVSCEAVGILGGLLTASTIPTWYSTLNRPFFAPPNWIFGPVWTLLYFMMGASIYLIWKKGFTTKKRIEALHFFLVQLGLNFIWSPVFFGLQSPLLALIVITVLWIAIVFTMKKLYPLSKPASYLLIPYLLWVSFATILNAAFVILN